ncbi:MAG TPA: hypothetical protein VMH77_02660 [Steroidobacteraceae bacterium]|nr:hypothetical protein [Steroidobacteraceae bacterium]
MKPSLFACAALLAALAGCHKPPPEPGKSPTPPVPPPQVAPAAATDSAGGQASAPSR